MKDQRAFGRPDDPFTYKIRLKRAPWLKTKLQLELLDGCDTGNWVPKATQVVLPGQVEVAWDRTMMKEYWDKAHAGKICKFRVRNLQSRRVLGPWDGPRLVRYLDQFTKEDIYYTLKLAFNSYATIGHELNLVLPNGARNIVLAGFKDLSEEQFDSIAQLLQCSADSMVDCLQQMVVTSSATSSDPLVDFIKDLILWIYRYAEDRDLAIEEIAEVLWEAVQAAKEGENPLGPILDAMVNGTDEIRELLQALMDYLEDLQDYIDIAGIDLTPSFVLEAFIQFAVKHGWTQGDIENILQAHAAGIVMIALLPYLGFSDSEVVDLANGVGAMLRNTPANWITGSPFPTAPIWLELPQFIAELLKQGHGINPELMENFKTAANLAQSGLAIWGFDLTNDHRAYNEFFPGVDIIAFENFLAGTMWAETALFVEITDSTDVEDLIQDITTTLTYIKNPQYIRSIAPGFPNYTKGIFMLIDPNLTAEQAQQIVDAFQSAGVPVIVVYEENGQTKVAHTNNISDEEANRRACQAGHCPDSSNPDSGDPDSNSKDGMGTITGPPTVDDGGSCSSPPCIMSKTPLPQR